MVSSRYGVRGRGISSGALLGLIAAGERRERAEVSPERVAFRARVRRVQLEGRVARGTAGGFYSEADVEHARAALAQLDASERMGL